ncbi:MAG: PVC-type heme-binding CxxCH protein [Rubripirellula sp.]
MPRPIDSESLQHQFLAGPPATISATHFAASRTSNTKAREEHFDRMLSYGGRISRHGQHRRCDYWPHGNISKIISHTNMPFGTPMKLLAIALLISMLPLVTCAQAAGPPNELNPELSLTEKGVKLTLIAEHPDVVTPTGLDVDSKGNIWLVCSHTHFRPEDYEGPEHDEIVVLQPDGTRSVFFNQTTATMDLELGPDGWVYLAERDRILRVRDSNNDGSGDKVEVLAQLQTEATYPHNGLSGLAWHPDGRLIFALGENFWKSWTLNGADQKTITGTGEGGIFCCTPEGKKLARIAKGFWNPFGVCVREDGTIFAAENDPGARPPCRLLHVVQGGDYGYQRHYGNAAFHPFVCWDGELRGTLPMLHSIAEAPCGIAPLGNGLIVPSWTDHRIDFYPLEDAGASFTTQQIPLIRGGKNFRPTCITKVTPTVFYLTDWVFGSYQLHGRGRVWKLEIIPESAAWLGPMELRAKTSQATLAEKLLNGEHSASMKELLAICRSEDRFLAHAAINALGKKVDSISHAEASTLSTNDQISLLVALRRIDPTNTKWVKYFLGKDNSEIRFETLRWISESRLNEFSDAVETMASNPKLDYKTFEAALATINTLAGNPQAGVADPAMLTARIGDTNAPSQVRAYALRLLDPRSSEFKKPLWQSLIATGDKEILRELTRALAANQTDNARKLLFDLAEDPSIPPAIRADAIAGLAQPSTENIPRLIELAESMSHALREEAIRSLRYCKLNEKQRIALQAIGKRYPKSADLMNATLQPAKIGQGRPAPSETAAWQQRLKDIKQPVDVEAGRRIFHHSQVGTCSKCHRHRGRGSVVGPDLSAVSNAGSPDRILRSILQPSRDVDPQYFPRMLVTDDGHIFTGIMLRDGGGGNEVYRDNTGRERVFKTENIIERKELHTSMMPEGLVDTLTDRELRDLIAFMNGQPGQLLSKGNKPQITTDSNKVATFLGTWFLDFKDGYGGWLDITENQEGLAATLMWRVGSAKPVGTVTLRDDAIVLTRNRKSRKTKYVATVKDGIITVTSDANKESGQGRRCPPMPSRPDLSKVQFGKPVQLFNGDDLSGWQLQPKDAQNGWRVEDGEMINETPKSDFSAYGEFGNLRTTRTFGDCKVHIEFNIGKQRNSGVYVRGLSEAQVVDRDSHMQGISGPGAIFGRIAPATNAGLPGGQWQTYDLTLVDRHMTVRLNGKLVIDNQPVMGATGGALFGDVMRDGPLYLQGDHTSVRYRNVLLSPRIE